MFKHFSKLLVLLLFFACTNSEPWTSTGLYYWQTKLDLSTQDWETYKDWKSQVLFIRLFDLDWDQRDLETGTLQVKTPLPPNQPWVPVVYLTVRQLAHLTPQTGEKLYSRIRALSSKVSQGTFSEVQIDADWSQSTRDGYFSLLKDLQARFAPQEVTATLRLHQVRDKKTMGIPPVKKAALMVYGLGDPGDYQSPINSVMDESLVKAYLDPELSDYPLDLDWAFPLYTQARFYNPFKKLFALVRDIDPSAINSLKKICEKTWEVQEAITIKDQRLMSRDLIKIDDIDLSAVQTASNLIHKLYRRQPGRLIFFDAQTSLLRRPFSHEIRKILSP